MCDVIPYIDKTLLTIGPLQLHVETTGGVMFAIGISTEEVVIALGPLAFVLGWWR